MTARPPGLPPLPAARVAPPPRGFEHAVRAAGRRRWRSLGGGAGVVATGLAVLLSLPVAAPGSNGLHPTAPGPVAPRPAGPASVAPTTPAAHSPSPTGRNPVAPYARNRRETQPGRESGGPGRGGPGDPDAAAPAPPAPLTGLPWTRAQQKADPQRQARCLSSENDDDTGVGSRFGDWCLTATATTAAPGKVAFAMAACALSPTAAPLTFPDGREVDFVVTAGDRHVWSSATRRTFPAEPGMVKADYGSCTVWMTMWKGYGDDGAAAAPGSYLLTAWLRLTSGSPRHRAAVTL
jgi:hypothetical protein